MSIVFLDLTRFNVQIQQSKFFMHNLFECRQEILLKQMACKRRSWVHHKRQKIVAFSGFDKIQRPNSTTEVLHAQFQQHDFSQNFSANHPDSGWLAHIRHYNLSSLPGLLKDIAVEKNDNRYDKKKSANEFSFVGQHAYAV